MSGERERATKEVALIPSSVSDSQSFWTNKSVIQLAQGKDPIDVVARVARSAVLNALEGGWSGPPFDPFLLADHLGIEVVPRCDVPDARLVPKDPGSVRIEFNPNQPTARARFSVAHELAHTLFPDHAETVRMRGDPRGDDWQLELLCNVAAAEFLMPVIGATGLESEPLTVENLIRLWQTFQVSAEAMLLRMVKLAQEPCAVFAAARTSGPGESPVFRLDYAVPSRSSRLVIPRGLVVSESTALSNCTAVGFTSRGVEGWGPDLPCLDVECVGIPAYPGDYFPRILGLLRLREKPAEALPQLIEVRGDATDPRGSGSKVIAHVVNDGTPNWGAGFAREVGKKWPDVQEDFVRWTRERPNNLSLGNIHLTPVSAELSVFHMVAQHGYGPSPKPRIRYAALAECLDQCGEYALREGASVHMPRIGTGQAGGQWNIIREIIDDILVRRGVEVTIYSLPDARPPKEVQQVLGSPTVGS